MWQWMLDRLSERSTWFAMITAGGTLGGMAIEPDKAEAIGFIGTLIASGIAASTREHKRHDGS
jgi:hypothetical protein